MRILSILSIAIIALLAFSGALQAQIAAPRLNPASLAPLLVFNPAVLPWGGPSRIGGGLVDLSGEVVVPGVGTFDFLTGDGVTAQVRLVGENFAFHAERLSISADVGPAFAPPGTTVDIDLTLVGAAYQGGEVFSIGIGFQGDKFSNSGGGSEENSLPLLGVTLRFGETIFAGAAAGTESVQQNAPELERSVVRVGAALHSRDTNRGYHLEAYIENKDSASDAGGFGPNKEETVGLTAEVILAGGFLIGLEIIDTDKTDPAGMPGGTEKINIFSLGWAASQGLSVVLNRFESEETDPFSGQVSTIEIISVGVAWMF